jgi:hypothetical protein
LLHAAGHTGATATSIGQILGGSIVVTLPSTLSRAHLLAATLALRQARNARAHESLRSALRIADETGSSAPSSTSLRTSTTS